MSDATSHRAANEPEKPVMCSNCGRRWGTVRWVGEGGALAHVHGMWTMWCEACALMAQIEHAEQRAALLPELRRKLKEALGA